MTIVPRNVGRQHAPQSVLSGLDFFVVLGLICIVIGVFVLARGELIGLASLAFGGGYLARFVADRRNERRRRARRA